MSELDRYKPLPADSIRAQTANGTPACVLTWINKPDGMIRLYASRKLHDIAWGQRTRESDSSVVWHMDANLDQVLIVDRDTARRMTARRTRCAQS